MGVLVTKLIEKFDLEILVHGDKNQKISVSDINRPGLQFSGFYNYFDNERIQVLGKAEWSFLDAMNEGIRRKRLKKFFEFKMPCLIISRNLPAQAELLEYAKLNNIWVMRTGVVTTKFINKIMNYLDEILAPETRVHGVLVDVYGLGILIIGESGIGKSETALELIKRGHRLVADDAVDIKQIDGSLKGSSPYITKGMLEVRGMGIIDVPALYGISSVLESKVIHLVISIEQWKIDKDYDRLGIEKNYTDILDVNVRHITVPIRPGRNIAVIIEAAAVNYRYSKNNKSSAVDIIEKRMEDIETK